MKIMKYPHVNIVLNIIRCISVDKPSSASGGSVGPPAGGAGGPMGLGALFAGGAPKLRPVGGTSRERSLSPGEHRHLCFARCIGVMAAIGIMAAVGLSAPIIIIIIIFKFICRYKRTLKHDLTQRI